MPVIISLPIALCTLQQLTDSARSAKLTDSSCFTIPSFIPAISVAQELEAQVCMPLQTPLIRGGPRLRRSKTPVTIRMIRRSVRLAAKPRAANSTKQAQSVLLKKLGVHVDDATVNSEIQKKFKETF